MQEGPADRPSYAPAKLVEALQNLGCKDENKIVIAEKIYRHLVEVVKVKDLQRMYDEATDMIYFRAEHSTSQQELVIPCPETVSVDMLAFEDLRKRLCAGNEHVSLAIVDVDSTIVYYTVVNNLVESKHMI